LPVLENVDGFADSGASAGLGRCHSTISLRIMMMVMLIM
jgi:hypothetical protein